MNAMEMQMNSICRDIFKAIHEGRWLSIEYQNKQGEKTLVFGMGYNEFSKFPEEGYSDMVATEFAKGNYYDCACSAGWAETKKLRIKVQIIDKYFGRLNVTISFKDENTVGVYMQKTAEDFLNEYTGFASGKSL